MKFNVIKLFMENKITEIANAIYKLWRTDTVCRYVAIWLVSLIPATILTYVILITCDPEASKSSSIVVAIVGLFYYTFFILGVGFIHLIGSVVFGWLASNADLAKRGIKVKADWKKDGV